MPWRSLSPSPPPRDHLGFHALPAAICLDNTPTARAGEVAASAHSQALKLETTPRKWTCSAYVDVPTGSDFSLESVRLWLLNEFLLLLYWIITMIAYL